jgi:hypothetical protein
MNIDLANRYPDTGRSYFSSPKCLALQRLQNLHRCER